MIAHLEQDFNAYLRYNINDWMSQKSKMDRRAFLRNSPKGIIIGAAAAYALQSYTKSTVYEPLTRKRGREKDPNEILKEIYKEVRELGRRDNEDFIKREFHIDLDNDDKNSEEHVVVLIHNVGDKRKMILQVTYFEPRGNNNIIKLAKDIRVVLCCIKGDKIEIEKCDYNEKEIKSLLPDILQGIRNKKKLLKLIDRKN